MILSDEKTTLNVIHTDIVACYEAALKAISLGRITKVQVWNLDGGWVYEHLNALNEILSLVATALERDGAFRKSLKHFEMDENLSFVVPRIACAFANLVKHSDDAFVWKGASSYLADFLHKYTSQKPLPCQADIIKILEKSDIEYLPLRDGNMGIFQGPHASLAKCQHITDVWVETQTNMASFDQLLSTLSHPVNVQTDYKSPASEQQLLLKNPKIRSIDFSSSIDDPIQFSGLSERTSPLFELEYMISINSVNDFPQLLTILDDLKRFKSQITTLKIRLKDVDEIPHAVKIPPEFKVIHGRGRTTIGWN